MTAIENYYDLLQQIEISDFKIGLYAKNPDEKEDLSKAEDQNATLRNELESLKMQLSEPSAIADEIRTSLIYVANGVLSSFAKIKQWGSYYPDLSQSMVIPGYLFGKILMDFNTALKYEGAKPIFQIYMSQREWDYKPFESLMQSLKDELIKANFSSKMEAIEYYEHIRECVIAIVDDLRNTGII
ncbi:hypothetical protein [Mucilaginibacter sp. FT3.2]|uniref:hypothetical protein n=1 Tax=Mucilaginibacter sp. FT3.2 TaxID=2723090 RepID=UPI0016079433|nr:hypothetical protein [Mucilaginibacter sp. FT3.2]MBB6231911.1 hypothetical protein [Mucilaginibacter sp. FT3.2]